MGTRKETKPMYQSYIATCPLELQSYVSREIRELGGVQLQDGFKAVQFKATIPEVYRMHLKLRCTSRLLRVLKTGSGSSLAIVSHQAGKIKWDHFFSERTSYLIEGVVGDRGPKAPSSTQISKAVRLGLEDYFNHKGIKKPVVDLKNPDLKIVAFVHQQRLTISIDTSGKTFHKRGYKLDSHPAPIKETLAAGILSACEYDGSENLYDPMCGSGTILIEAANIALNKAPLIHRKRGEFSLEKMKDFDYQTWRKVQDDVRHAKLPSTAAQLHGSDINLGFTEMTRTNALRARVEKYLSLRHGDFLKLAPPCSPGLLICNLPYGTRIEGEGDSANTKEFYQEIGNQLKKHYSGWRAALLVAQDAPYKFIGLRPSKKINILNGSIPCKLLIYDLYQGSKKSKD